MENDKLISLRLPAELYEQIKEHAQSIDRPVAWVIRQALEAFVRTEHAKEEAYLAGP